MDIQGLLHYWFVRVEIPALIAKTENQAPHGAQLPNRGRAGHPGNPAGDGQVAAEARFDIDRTRLRRHLRVQPLFCPPGHDRVYDRISFDIRIVFRPAASSA